MVWVGSVAVGPDVCGAGQCAHGTRDRSDVELLLVSRNSYHPQRGRGRCKGRRGGKERRVSSLVTDAFVPHPSSDHPRLPLLRLHSVTLGSCRYYWKENARFKILVGLLFIISLYVPRSAPARWRPLGRRLRPSMPRAHPFPLHLALQRAVVSGGVHAVRQLRDTIRGLGTSRDVHRQCSLTDCDLHDLARVRPLGVRSLGSLLRLSACAGTDQFQGES